MLSVLFFLGWGAGVEALDIEVPHFCEKEAPTYTGLCDEIGKACAHRFGNLNCIQEKGNPLSDREIHAEMRMLFDSLKDNPIVQKRCCGTNAECARRLGSLKLFADPALPASASYAYPTRKPIPTLSTDRKTGHFIVYSPLHLKTHAFREHFAQVILHEFGHACVAANYWEDMLKSTDTDKPTAQQTQQLEKRELEILKSLIVQIGGEQDVVTCLESRIGVQASIAQWREMFADFVFFPYWQPAAHAKKCLEPGGAGRLRPTQFARCFVEWPENRNRMCRGKTHLGLNWLPEEWVASRLPSRKATK